MKTIIPAQPGWRVEHKLDEDRSVTSDILAWSISHQADKPPDPITVYGTHTEPDDLTIYRTDDGD